MATNNFKPKGQENASKQDAGGGVLRSLPVLGVVKNNIDANRSGRIQVYIADFGAPNPEDKTSWTTVSYMSPFFGSTLPTASADTHGTYTTNPSSYGMWFSPPDVGSTVVCLFINGNPNYGYYIGGVLDPELLQMIPAIGSSDNVVFNKGEANSYGGATRMPVTNLNSNNPSLANSSLFLDVAKPAHSYAASIFSQQGLIRDNIRGPITSSALRESPSRVGWGVSTPGRPIYQGGFTDTNINSKSRDSSVTNESLKVISRRGGHSIVMDDGTSTGRDNLIRIRTSLGHQITMSDDGQTLFIIHSNGQSYVELGKEGTIDLYATNSVNVRTQGDLNLHADNNININAKKDLNISANNLKIGIEKDISFRAGANFSGYTLGNYSIKVNGTMSMGSNGEGSYASSAIMYFNGSNINLNTGATSAPPKEVPALPVVAHTDTLFDSAKGWAAAPASLISIVSRAPAHQPWSNGNQGVDVKVNNNASAVLPAAPSPAVAAANSATTTAPNNPPTAATVSSVPATQGASNSLDKNTTAAMVSGVAATAAAKVPTSITAGSSVVTNALNQVTAAVGPLGLTPKMMENAQVLKAGSAPLVNSLISSGANTATAMPSSLFTGLSGATSLSSFAQNIPAQVSSQVANFQQAQSALTQTGLITGKEAPSQIAGMVTSTAQLGLGPTTDFIKNSSSVAALPVGQVAALSGGPAAGFAGLDPNAFSSALVSSGVDLKTGKIASVDQALATGNISAGAAAFGGSFQNIAAGLAPGNLSKMGLPDATGAVAEAMSTGKFSANLGTNLPGGLSSIATSLTGLGKPSISGVSGVVDAAKGITGSAFGAIVSSFKSFKANVPQNLSAIAATNSAAQAANEVAAQPPAVKNAANVAIPNISQITSSLKAGVAEATSAMSGAAGAAGSAFPGLAGGFSSLPSIAGSGLNTTIDAASNVLGSGGPLGQVMSGGSGLGGSIGSSLTGGFSSVSSIASGGLNTTINAASNVLSSNGPIGQTLASGSLSSQITTGIGSGLSALPGGASAVSSFVNNTPGASALSNIPGVSGITSIMNDKSSAAQNGISQLTSSLSTPGALISGTATGLPTNISGINLNSLSEKMKVGDQSLTALASSGLPAGDAAKLQASVNSLSSSSPFPIKMPTVATNTTDRSEVTSQISTNLGETKIPPPSFSGYTGTVDQSYNVNKERKELLVKKRAEYYTLSQNYEIELAKRSAAIKAEAAAYAELKNTLPQGDPEREKAKALGLQHNKEFEIWYKDQVAKLDAKVAEINELQDQIGQTTWNDTKAQAQANLAARG